MRKIAGILGLVLALLIALPTVSLAKDHPKKYGVELQLGGGYYLMDDINNYLPNELNLPGVGSPDKINIGEQVGLGISYRLMDNFGWQFGFNKMAFIGIQKYRMEALLPSTPATSWAEQTISGSEFYALATWFTTFGPGEFMFSVGPAVYSASLDRSIDILNDASGGSHITRGSFADATGKSMGIIASMGISLGLSEVSDLIIQVGGRYANVSELTYEDPSTQQDEVVYKNVGTGSNLSVDFSGAFLKLSLRTYFKPASGWRSPKR